MAGSEFNTVSGLARVLDNPRWPVARACAAVTNCLEMSRCCHACINATAAHQHSGKHGTPRRCCSNLQAPLLRRDNYRPFFEQTFPLLLRRVFGYDGASWLTVLARDGREADVSALLDLLSPTGAGLTSWVLLVFILILHFGPLNKPRMKWQTPWAAIGLETGQYQGVTSIMNPAVLVSTRRQAVRGYACCRRRCAGAVPLPHGAPADAHTGDCRTTLPFEPADSDSLQPAAVRLQFQPSTEVCSDYRGGAGACRLCLHVDDA